MKTNTIKQRGWVVFSLFVLTTALAGILCVLAQPHLLADGGHSLLPLTDTGPMAPVWESSGNLSQMVAQSNRRSLDPAGFAFLQHLGDALGITQNSSLILPFIGFLGMAATGFRILRCSEVPVNEALLLTSLFASSSLLFPYAAQQRSYSFEAWGTLYALSVLYRYTPQKSGWWKLKAGLVISFFLWMRYPFWIAAGVTGMLLFFKILLKKDNRLWLHYLCFIMPQIVSATLIYFFCTRFQSISISVPEYAQAATLHFGGGFLLRPAVLLLHGAVLIFFLLMPFRERFRYPIHLGRFGLFTGFLFFAWNTLSLLGAMPSDPSSRWAISLNALAMMCLFMALAILLFYIPVRFKPFTYLMLAALTLYQPLQTAQQWYGRKPTTLVPKRNHSGVWYKIGEK